MIWSLKDQVFKKSNSVMVKFCLQPHYSPTSGVGSSLGGAHSGGVGIPNPMQMYQQMMGHKGGGGARGPHPHSADPGRPYGPASSYCQVWPLTQFFMFPFCKKIIQWPGETPFSSVPPSNSSPSRILEGLFKLLTAPFKGPRLSSCIVCRTTEM